MREYQIRHIAGQPDWPDLPIAPIDILCWTKPLPISAYAQLAWDDTQLFVHLHADEKNIRAEVKDPLGQPCQDSCLEFFFSPDPSSDRYINFEVNPLGTLFLGYGSCIQDLTRLMVDDPRSFFRITTAVSAEGWDLSYSLPFAFLRRFFPSFVPEGSIRGNFYKCGDLTLQAHYLAWNPVLAENPAFHRPQDFGRLIFLP